MKSFRYLIKDELGVHARPAGLIVKEAKQYDCLITIQRDAKNVDASKLMALMGLGIKQNDMVEVVFEGKEEEKAYQGFLTLFEEYL